MATPKCKIIVPGNVIAFTNATTAAMSIGDPVQIDGKCGVLSDAGQGTSGPNATLAASATTGQCVVSGPVYGPKATGAAWAAGQRIYWDSGNGCFDSAVPSAGWVAGRALAAVAQATAYGIVELNVQPLNDNIEELVPANPVHGDTYFTQSDLKIHVYTGTAWKISAALS